MATKGKKGSGAIGAREKNDFGVEFVNIYLTEQDKATLREWTVSEADLWLHVERLTDTGYKVSLSVDLHNTGGVCALTGSKGCAVPENAGKCLVSRGPDIRGALLSCLYKLQVYCPDGVFPGTADPRAGDWG